MSRTAIAFAFLSMSLVGTPASAASFDCTKASTFQEQNICGSQLLSQLDESLSAAYKEALNASATPDMIKNDQRAWLAKRNQCFNEICLRSTLESRISELQRAAEPQVEALATSYPTEPAPTLPATADTAPTARQQPATSSPAPAQSVDAASTAQPLADGYSYGAGPSVGYSDEVKKDSEMSLATKIALVILTLICVVSIYLHHRGRLTIYHDFTDATFTSVIPILTIGLMWLLAWLEVPKPYHTYAGLGLGGIMSLVVLRSTIAANGFSIWFLMALTTKVTMIAAFYMVMILLFFNTTARKAGETAGAFERRRRRESREARAAMVAVTAIFTGLSAWLCRERQFSPVGDYLAGRTH